MAKPVTRGVRNRLGEIRVRRGLAASDLARRINVTRQTIYAIEAGTYVPNTEVALNLARELEVTVDELFSLQEGAAAAADSINAEVLGSAPSVKGQPVRICQIGSHWISVPVSAAPYYLPEADGIVQRPAGRGGQAKLTVFGGDAAAGKRLILAGCDPASSFLSHMAEKAAGVEIVSAAASSKLALTWLMEGKVHIAGSHLEDPGTGEFNLPFLRSRFPDEDLAVITFARWEEGLVVAKGNPKGVRGIEDLARRNVKMANREPGSGSRGLLDRLLKDAGIESSRVRGYDQVARGHLAAAWCVVAGEADVCLATGSAARTFGLAFVPLNSERYDLVMRRDSLQMPAVRAFLDVLQLATLRRKLEVLAGYDTTETGTLVA